MPMRLFGSKKEEDIEKKAPVNTLVCRIASLSETGPTRTHNEDHICVTVLSESNNHVVAALADGMGGHNAGEIASRLACERATSFYEKFQKDAATAPILKAAIDDAHQTILQQANENASQKGMGSTLSMIVINNDKMHFGHVGDSRIYLYRENRLQQVSKNHSLVQQLFEEGKISYSDMASHPEKNILLQALGTKSKITPQISENPIQLNLHDIVFICSDGITDMLSEEELASLLRMENIRFFSKCIRALANAAKASDNYSFILLSFLRTEKTATRITKEQNILE